MGAKHEVITVLLQDSWRFKMVTPQVCIGGGVKKVGAELHDAKAIRPLSHCEQNKSTRSKGTETYIFCQKVARTIIILKQPDISRLLTKRIEATAIVIIATNRA